MLIAARSHLTRTRKTERFVLLCLRLCLGCARPRYGVLGLMFVL